MKFANKEQILNNFIIEIDSEEDYKIFLSFLRRYNLTYNKFTRDISSRLNYSEIYSDIIVNDRAVDRVKRYNSFRNYSRVEIKDIRLLNKAFEIIESNL